MEEDWEEQRREAAEAREAYAKERQEFRTKLFGSSDCHDWQAPSPVENFDELLAEHAAQLRNAARHAMGITLDDGHGPETLAQAASALTRMIQTNIAITKVLGAQRETSKTVRGGSKAKDAQD